MELTAREVVFFANLKLASNSDRKILSAFPYIIKYKGSIYAIELVTNLFEQLMNTSVYTRTSATDKNRITIVFKDYTKHVELLYYLIEYVRPTGLIVDYTVEKQIQVDTQTDYTTEDVVITYCLSAEDNVIQKCKTEKVDRAAPFISNIGFVELSKYNLTTTKETNDEKQ